MHPDCVVHPRQPAARSSTGVPVGRDRAVPSLRKLLGSGALPACDAALGICHDNQESIPS